jgi:hypothetical protein
MHIPVNPHAGAREEDLPGDRHHGCYEHDGHEDMAEQACIGGGVHGLTHSRLPPRVSSTLAAICDYR